MSFFFESLSLYQMITKKFFPADKNYLLKDAQNTLQVELNQSLFEIIKSCYFTQFNPLGIEDDFIMKLKGLSVKDLKFLNRPYQMLSAIYRYQYGDNQLEFLWDGTSHHDKYSDDWKSAYARWIADLCLANPSFTRAFTKFIYSADGSLNTEFLESYLYNAILNHFGFKFYQKKGLLPRSA